MPKTWFFQIQPPSAFVEEPDQYNSTRREISRLRPGERYVVSIIGLTSNGRRSPPNNYELWSGKIDWNYFRSLRSTKPTTTFQIVHVFFKILLLQSTIRIALIYLRFCLKRSDIYFEKKCKLEFSAKQSTCLCLVEAGFKLYNVYSLSGMVNDYTSSRYCAWVG